jgi:signal transduction histidine kinase
VADRVELRIDETLNQDAAQLQLGIYRIIEQALINAITHGPASEIKITATVTLNSDYLVSVVDNGPGAILAERSVGYGTAVIQSWVSILGGTKTVESSPGHGYKLSVLVPGSTVG